MFRQFDRIRYLIQWDNRSKRYPFAVTTVSGQCLGYFRNVKDAETFCAVQS